MENIRRFARRGAQILGGLLVAASAHAAYSGLYVFGDSLSDNGNIPASSGFRPSSPYADGRFSNGPVAAEYLAANLGIAAADFHDFAIGGAQTGLFNGEVPLSNPYALSGTLTQTLYYHAASGGVADPNALYVVWAGPNDFFSLNDPAQASNYIIGGVTSLLIEVAILHAMGAQHILVPNMPDLGLTPAMQPIAPFATAYSTAFNQVLDAYLPSYVTTFDTFGFMQKAVADPGSFGFTNVTDACVQVAACVSGSLEEQNQYLFWDAVHPTTAAHRILGERFADAVTVEALATTPVPEPETTALLAAGLAVVAGMARRRRKS